jgi:1,4-alpha-glucan branching enzyme
VKTETGQAASTPVDQPKATGGTEATSIQDTEEKLADYYGVNQVSDAVMFVTLYPRASTVQIAGDFNNWQPESSCMERIGDNGTWRAKMDLTKGRYRYRLVVDGQWQQDPYNENMEMNPYGDYNSVLEVH